MQLSQVYLGLGEPALGELLKGISLGKLKTFQLYERLKLRLHLSKLNSETLRRSAIRLWPRLQEGDEDLASLRPKGHMRFATPGEATLRRTNMERNGARQSIRIPIRAMVFG